MTLTIQTKEDSQRQLKVTVEVPEDRVQAQMRKTARRLSKQLNIPGFRRGKVPYQVIINRFGEGAVRGDAVEDMLESIIMEALEEVDAAPYRQPTLDDMDMEPLTLHITIPIEPEVKLGDYRAIRKDVQEIEVTEEALAEALEHVRSHHQILEEVDRPLEQGDMVTVTGEGKINDEEGEIIWQEQNTELVMDPERLFPDLPFVDNVIGLSAGESKEFKFSFPDAYEEEELSGKEAIFNVSIIDVKSRTLPELTDELAKEEGDYDSVEELTEALRKELHNQAERQAKAELLDEVVEGMLETATIVYPPVLVEEELIDTLENMKAQVTRSGWQWDDYLKLQSQTEEKLKDDWREGATERVRRGLVLREFVREEKLTVNDEEIDAAVDERVSQFSDNEELQSQLRSIYKQGQGLEAIANEVLMEKVQERVELIVTGNAPDLAGLENDREVLEKVEEEE